MILCEEECQGESAPTVHNTGLRNVTQESRMRLIYEPEVSYHSRAPQTDVREALLVAG